MSQTGQRPSNGLVEANQEEAMKCGPAGLLAICAFVVSSTAEPLALAQGNTQELRSAAAPSERSGLRLNALLVTGTFAEQIVTPAFKRDLTTGGDLAVEVEYRFKYGAVGAGFRFLSNLQPSGSLRSDLGTELGATLNLKLGTPVGELVFLYLMVAPGLGGVVSYASMRGFQIGFASGFAISITSRASLLLELGYRLGYYDEDVLKPGVLNGTRYGYFAPQIGVQFAL
jgi:hypothetical protein